MLRIERHPNGPRVYVLGLRLHHGLTGCALVVLGAANRANLLLLSAGALLVLDDLRDFPWPLRERSELRAR